MRIFLKAFLLSALFFVAAQLLVSRPSPTACRSQIGHQSGWQVQIAFVLMSVENIRLFGMAIVMLLALVNRFRRLVAR
jgi:hypothetical protein